MSLAATLDLFFGNLGMAYEPLILFIIVLMALIFSVQSHKIGLISLFIMSLTAFIYFALNNLNFVLALILMFVSIILMAFSIYTTRQQGGFF